MNSKTPKEILYGAFKVIGYAGISVVITGLISYLQQLSATATGITLIIVNSLVYVLVQISQSYFAKK